MEFQTLLSRAIIVCFIVFVFMRLVGKWKIGIPPITSKQPFESSLKLEEASYRRQHIRLESLPIPIIMEGKVSELGLESIGKTRFWLKRELDLKGISSTKEVYFCSVDYKGVTYLILNRRPITGILSKS